jgi:hypothetical protein
MIAFAAKAGSTASDGDSDNGPFPKALVDDLPKPGLDLRLAFGYVRDEVLKSTGYQQEPYVYGSLAETRSHSFPLPRSRPILNRGPIAADKAAAELAAKEAADKGRLATLSPPADKTDRQTAIDLPRALQVELRRVGCATGTVDGNWNTASQKALDLFNKHAGMKLDRRTASADALDAVKSKTGRVCPLICASGYHADGDRCAKTTCRTGYELNDDGVCVKNKQTAKREEKAKPETPERPKVDVAPAKPQVSGQIICTQGGCRPLRSGCRIVSNSSAGIAASGATLGQQREVCN